MLQFSLGEEFPGTPTQTQVARAEAFFLARRWSEARSEYATLLPKLSGSARDRAVLRVAQCDVQSGGKPEVLNALSLTDPELDAERIFTMSQAHRSQKLESQMLDEVDQLAKRFPQSSWVGEGLFAAGNYYWVNMDRDARPSITAAPWKQSPTGKMRHPPHGAWPGPLIWTASRKRPICWRPMSADSPRRATSRMPCIGWAAPTNAREILDHARSFYLAAADAISADLFWRESRARAPGAGGNRVVAAATQVDFLSVIPAAPALPQLDQPAHVKLQERQARARALSDIAFDASAELEYRAAYAETHSPKFLIEAAGAAVAAGHYAAGIVAVRQAFPQLEARRVSEIPNQAWRAAFPLPYESSVRSAAARNQLDPMLVAGLIRQESAFESSAMSRAGAVGLMQVMPKTASKLARQLKVRYARARLTDPGYNLQLGSRYLARSDPGPRNTGSSFGCIQRR